MVAYVLCVCSPWLTSTGSAMLLLSPFTAVRQFMDYLDLSSTSFCVQCKFLPVNCS